MSHARFIIADVFEGLASLPDDSVDFIMSNPPFLALRSYLPADHPDKGKEIGSEPTPAGFIDTLLDVVEACDRVLAPHGSLAFELGDTFAGGGGAGGDYNPGGLSEGQDKFEGSGYVARQDTKYAKVQRSDHRSGVTNLHGKVQGGGNGWPEAKSLCGIPHLFANSLAYGRNLLRPERTTPQWRIRNMVVWARPNPPVGALGDKFRPATSYLTVATKSRTRWFDLDAVRGVGSPNTHARTARGVDSRPSTGKTADDERRGGNFSTLDTLHDTNGGPPLDYWVIPTAPFKGSHYATYPPELCRIPIQSMCPREVCRVCGEPRRRITEAEYEAHGIKRDESKSVRGGAGAAGQHAQAFGEIGRATKHVTTLGWTDCGHDDFRPGVVLDPFAGSGTTLSVATGHGRDAVGIDIDARNAELARNRAGMFLEVSEPEVVA